MARRLKGVQEPSFKLVPRHRYSDGPDACDLAAGYGMVPDPWQRTVMEGWFATTADGRYCADDVGLAVPRQNGKNGILEFAELYMSAILGRKILHTAHEVKTCRKHFMRMKAYFENDRKYPEMAELVDYIRNTNGQEAIVLKNGGSIEFIARSKSSGRGFTVDILVCDEAQELTDEQMEAIQPATSSAPSGNPLNVYTGTPTPPHSPGTVFARIRRQAHEGAKRLCWYEWSVPEIGDIHDTKRWELTNPSLGIRLLPQVIESEVKKFSPDGFARERLGWWNDGANSASDIDQKHWKACATKNPTLEGYPAYAVKFSPDGRHVSLAVCQMPGRHDEDRPHVELIDYKSMGYGTTWLADWLTSPPEPGEPERWRNSRGIVVDGRVGAPTLVNQLRERGVPPRIIWTPGSGQQADACSMLEQAINAEKLTNFPQPALDDAVAHARHRRIGSDGFGYESSMENIDVTPVEAIAYAYWCAKTSRRNPGRKAKAVVL